MDTIVEEGADVAGKKGRQKAVKFDEATEALEMTRQTCLGPQLTETAYAELVRE